MVKKESIIKLSLFKSKSYASMILTDTKITFLDDAAFSRFSIVIDSVSVFFLLGR